MRRFSTFLRPLNRNQSVAVFRKIGQSFFGSSTVCRNLPMAEELGKINNLNNTDKTAPRKTKIDSPEFRSLFTPELQLILNLFNKNNYELRIAGGAVRDLLLGKVPHDVDFATTATPQQMMDLFEREGIRMLNKRGEKHGTVTCRVNDRENFEITTLRIDKVCNGRHAEVEFTTDWFLDANRRDLTVNSLFLGFDGTVYDFFGGVEDLKNRRIAFVRDPVERIQEDYLRILRYFRFFGRLANNPDQHEDETIKAISDNVSGLKGISGERLWMELKQIVIGRFAGPVVHTMINCGVGPYLGLPTNPNVSEFVRIAAECEAQDPKPMTLLSALLHNEDDVQDLDRRLKLSNKERTLGSFMMRQRSLLPKIENNHPKERERIENYFKDLIIDLNGPGTKVAAGEEFVYELLKYAGQFEMLDSLKNWKCPKFPVDGVMIMKMGVRKGPIVKEVLLKLFERWKESNCEATAEQLLANADCFVQQRDRSRSPQSR